MARRAARSPKQKPRGFHFEAFAREAVSDQRFDFLAFFFFLITFLAAFLTFLTAVLAASLVASAALLIAPVICSRTGFSSSISSPIVVETSTIAEFIKV